MDNTTCDINMSVDELNLNANISSSSVKNLDDSGSNYVTQRGRDCNVVSGPDDSSYIELADKTRHTSLQPDFQTFQGNMMAILDTSKWCCKQDPKISKIVEDFEELKRQKICDSVEIPVLTRCCFCFPLRKGLISFGYINLILTLAMTALLTMISFLRIVPENHPMMDGTEFPRHIADLTGLIIEGIMTVVFIVALHMKHVLMMRVYLYFEIVFSGVGLIYGIAFLTKETAQELFLIIFQLFLQIYLVILIRSSIIKMERDGTVKYVRDRDNAV